MDVDHQGIHVPLRAVNIVKWRPLPPPDPRGARSGLPFHCFANARKKDMTQSGRVCCFGDASGVARYLGQRERLSPAQSLCRHVYQEAAPG